MGNDDKEGNETFEEWVTAAACGYFVVGPLLILLVGLVVVLAA